MAIARLEAANPDHYAFWVLESPFPRGYVHHDRSWQRSLTQAWQAWQGMFSQGLAIAPRFAANLADTSPLVSDLDHPSELSTMSYSSRLMQHLGLSLWQWLFDGAIKSSFDQSEGIAMGQGRPLRLRLDIRDPDLISLPWEIMQSEPGKQAISLSQQLLFSRTTTAVDPLPPSRADYALRVLLVLGQADEQAIAPATATNGDRFLNLEQEAQALSQALEHRAVARLYPNGFAPAAPSVVDTLVQPTLPELVNCLESNTYNVFFYAGHGTPAPDGGLLYLRPDACINGTELAQVLTRCQVKLAVFNACWGAQPAKDAHQAPIPRSSLAEVLIHHGVPAVLAMRDMITDAEALSFIEVFAQALAERTPIDRAVAIGRQQLLTLYKFNQPAWTLPVLYMHPEFDGELLRPVEEGVTEIPDTSTTWLGRRAPSAFLRPTEIPSQTWPIQGGIMRVGKWEGNDLVIHGPGVSRKHAEIFYRDATVDDASPASFYLRDFSRYGTLILRKDGWQRIHHREVMLPSKTQLKFGSHRCQTIEFVVDNVTDLS